MKNILKDLAEYRVKVERDGREIMSVPGILCLPGLLAAPKMSIAGMIAAPLLGCSIRLENGDGREEDLEKAVKKAAERVMDTAKNAVKTIRKEMDEAWQAMSEEDRPETEDAAPRDEAAVQDAAEDPEKDIPAVPVNPDDSVQA